jgi:hypothetical protein
MMIVPVFQWLVERAVEAGDAAAAPPYAIRETTLYLAVGHAHVFHLEWLEEMIKTGEMVILRK